MASNTRNARSGNQSIDPATYSEEYTLILQLKYYPISPNDSETSVLDPNQEWPDEPPAENGSAATSTFDVDKLIVTVKITLADFSAARVWGLHSFRPQRQIETIKFIDPGGLALIDPYRMREEKAKTRWNDCIHAIVENTKRKEEAVRGVVALDEDETEGKEWEELSVSESKSEEGASRDAVVGEESDSGADSGSSQYFDSRE